MPMSERSMASEPCQFRNCLPKLERGTSHLGASAGTGDEAAGPASTSMASEPCQFKNYLQKLKVTQVLDRHWRRSCRAGVGVHGFGVLPV